MFRTLMKTQPTWMTLPVRLALGCIFIAHGAQKVFGVWGGKGLSAFIEGTAPFGLQPAWLWLGAAAFAELFGGLLVLLGLLTRFGALMIVPVMLVAMFGVHWGRFFLQDRGIEYTLALLAMALALLIAGGGRISFDEALSDTRTRRR
ncbi:MAG: DoxX family protein [Pyrinomonadaceae bacterium]|nr:DoxX family protein [Pyrinomonadaceae bacterium]